jgi:hypothetical protein
MANRNVRIRMLCRAGLWIEEAVSLAFGDRILPFALSVYCLADSKSECTIAAAGSFLATGLSTVRRFKCVHVRKHRVRPAISTPTTSFVRLTLHTLSQPYRPQARIAVRSKPLRGLQVKPKPLRAGTNLLARRGYFPPKKGDKRQTPLCSNPVLLHQQILRWVVFCLHLIGEGCQYGKSQWLRWAEIALWPGQRRPCTAGRRLNGEACGRPGLPRQPRARRSVLGERQHGVAGARGMSRPPQCSP